MVIFGLISTVFDLLTFYFLFTIFHLSEGTFQAGWFIESLATQILVIYVIRTQKIPFIQSRPSKTLTFATLGILSIGFIITLKGIGSFFGFDSLPLNAYLIIAALVIVYLLIVEGVKQIFYKTIKNK